MIWALDRGTKWKISERRNRSVVRPTRGCCQLSFFLVALVTTGRIGAPAFAGVLALAVLRAVHSGPGGDGAEEFREALR
ncbi:hypothetical protein [Pseudonocardia kunmingensis]|uniref:hypothetical protein n=1 Tax=Pseudonocardia kunmingensis TaxID=630975 RepID=UPI0011544DB0|nr:hypothetical protein [Pseudonocardia kunmingensis]